MFWEFFCTVLSAQKLKKGVKKEKWILKKAVQTQ